MMTDKEISEVASLVMRDYEKWLAFHTKALLPPVCLRWISERKNLKAVSDYMKRHRIRVEITPGGSKKLMHGDRLVAIFSVSFQKG